MEIKIQFDTTHVMDSLSSNASHLMENLEEAMEISMRDVAERAKEHHRFISRTGDAENSIKYETRMGMGAIHGMVYTTKPHAVYQHEGTSPHVIVPRNKKVLRFTADGKFIFSKRVRVGGIKADPYIYRAYEEEEVQIMKRLQTIIPQVILKGR